jgi:pyruvate dehydrogenase E1 component
MKALPLSVATYFPGRFVALGTDGFGLSEERASLRDHFEVNAKHIVYTTLAKLHEEGKIDGKILPKAMKKLGIQPDKINPALV